MSTISPQGGDTVQDSDLTEQFLDALWIERNLAQNTLSSYRQDLKTLTDWLTHRG